MAPHQRARNAIQCSSRAPLPNTHRFAIRFAYDGIGYHGYQSQANQENCPTVQDAIESRLRQLLNRKVRVLGWGRTDVGVHANGAVCTVDLGLEEIKRLSFHRRRRKLAGVDTAAAAVPTDRMATIHDTTTTDNDDDQDEAIPWEAELSRAAQTIQSTLKEFKCSPNLPGSITARRCTPVPPTFDARFSCLWKRYVYIISCSKIRSPILSRYSWQMDSKLDFDAMVQAANLLSGCHDFSWLSVIEPGDKMNPIRDLSLTVEKVVPTAASSSLFLVQGSDTDSDTSTTIIYKISAKCDFFLYKMVRRIVGALVVIGSGKVPLCELESCIRAHDDVYNHETNATDSGTDIEYMTEIPQGLLQTAPANGLTLDHVEYGISI